MNVGELVEHIRSDVLRDEATPPLWSDALLVRYLNEAIDQFTIRTHCLQDETSTFTTVETVPGVTDYPLDPRIVFVAEVVDVERGAVLRDRSRTRVGFRSITGRPVSYRLDASHSKLKLYPTPDDEYELQMLVARKPLEPLVNDTDEPEIPEHFHLKLCDWVAYRCLRNNDPDGGKMMDAEPFRVDWEMTLRDAKRELYRLRTGANPMAARNWTGKR